MAFSHERVDAGMKYWRMLPFHQRTERELQLALMRMGLVDIDAKNYARDLIAAADDLEPDRKGLRPCYLFKGTPETYHKESQERRRELCWAFGWKGDCAPEVWLRDQLQELHRLRAQSEGSTGVSPPVNTGDIIT